MNWKTTASGIVAAIPILFDAVMKQDWAMVGNAIGLLLLAYFAKDK